MDSFELEIIKPTKKTVLNVEWVDAKSPSGNFFIGPKHSDLISILKEKSPLTYKKVDSIEPESINIYGGYLKIENGKVLVVLDL
ncbi:hypothetical protein GF385_02590 [Candidatus Dependentiae bacterium]|nr:hypothetical protein [Candidatus Dependentiae bacterium]